MAKIVIPTFLKWAGGKRKLIKQIEPLPEKINGYFEPFLGGGAMFFYIKQKYKPKYCMLSDINKDLIETFKSVRDKPKDLIEFLSRYKEENTSDFYYEVRKKFNGNEISGIERSAAFIYLNKTCYNGLYRVNSKNEFNVPYGKYKNPEIVNSETLLVVSKLLKDVEIKHQEYWKILDYVKKDDFVYLDPCYDPLRKTSFANYTSKRFCEKDRIELARFIRLLKNKDVKIILSNNDLSEIRGIYSDFEIKEIFASRTINSNVNDRGKVKELVIKSI